MASAKPQNRLIFFIFLILSVHAVHFMQVIAAFESYAVNVTSGLPDHTDPLVFDCESQGVDLGNHTLYINESFQFEVRASNPDVSCRYWWSPRETANKVLYRVLAEKYCLQKGNQIVCHWYVLDDGFYLTKVSNPGKSDLTLIYKW